MTPTANLWEWKAELETIHDLVAGTSSPGHRIRYRRQGGRRWSTFLLTTDTGESPTDSMVTQAIEAHAGVGRNDHSASRRVDVLEHEAPHLIAPSPDAAEARHGA